MFIKMGHHYVDMKKVESFYCLNKELRVTTEGGRNYYAEVEAGNEEGTIETMLSILSPQEEKDA